MNNLVVPSVCFFVHACTSVLLSCFLVVGLNLPKYVTQSCICHSFVLFCVIISNWQLFHEGLLPKYVAKSCICQWIVLFCLIIWNGLLFRKGLLSFSIVFGVSLTPGGSGNKAFQI